MGVQERCTGPTSVSLPKSRSPLKHGAGQWWPPAIGRVALCADALKFGPVVSPTNCVICQHPRRCKMPTAKPTAPRRRNRKRKRRLASSSSSDSSDSSSDDTSKETAVKKAPLKKQTTPSSAESSSSPSPSSSSTSSSDSENEDNASHVGELATALISSAKSRRDDPGHHPPVRPRSPSPSPPPADAPPFLPPNGSSSRAQDEQALRNRFRQFWMASVADAFGDDLEQIRQVRLQP